MAQQFALAVSRRREHPARFAAAGLFESRQAAPVKPLVVWVAVCFSGTAARDRHWQRSRCLFRWLWGGGVAIVDAQQQAVGARARMLCSVTQLFLNAGQH